MNKFLLFAFLLLISVFGNSQDKIHLWDGDSLSVKVTENSKSKITYKKFDNLSGPSYVLNKSQISKIIYENGETETYKRTAAPTVENESGTKDRDFNDDFDRIKEKSTRFNKKRHLLGFNYGQMIILNMEFSYEVILTKSGFIGLKIPFNVGMNLKNQYLKKNNLISTGIHVNAYPMGQGKVAYFTGPAIRYYYMADNPNYHNAVSPLIEKAHYIGFYMNNGVLFQASSFLNFSLGLGLGVRRDVSRETSLSTFDVIFDGTIIFRL